MTIDAITFEMGGFPSVELQLASSEGLAPLAMPQSLRQPPQEAVRRFQAAMEGNDGEASRRGTEPSETPSNGEVVTKPAFAPIVVEQTPHPENPVNPVNPVKDNNLTALNPVIEELPVQATQDFRFESQCAYRRELFQTGFTGFERVVEPSETPSDGEVVTKPAVAPIVVEQTPHPENPVNLVNPVKENNSEAQMSDGREFYQTGFTGFERVVEPSEAPSNGEVVAKPAVAPIGVDNTPQPENPVNPVNPVKDNNLPALNPVAEPSEAPSNGEVVAKPTVVPVVADNTSQPDNLVNPVNPVKENKPTPLNSAKVTENAATLRVPNSVEELIEQAEEPKVEVPFVRKERTARTETPEALPGLNVLHGLANPTAANPVNDVSGSVAAALSARTEAVNATVAKAVEAVNQIVEAVVAEISVTSALAQGDGEIRITLKPTVLDGSEIRLSAKTGEMTVYIVPATPEAAETTAISLPRLQAALAAHVPAFHHVAVVVATAKKGNER